MALLTIAFEQLPASVAPLPPTTEEGRLVRELVKCFFEKEALQWFAGIEHLKDIDRQLHTLAAQITATVFGKFQQLLEDEFRKTLEAGQHLLHIARRLQDEGVPLDATLMAELEGQVQGLEALLNWDTGYSETEGYQQMVRQAIAEYKAGQTEELGED